MTNSIALSQLFFPSSSSLVLPSAAISRIVTTTMPLSSEIGIKPNHFTTSQLQNTIKCFSHAAWCVHPYFIEYYLIKMLDASLPMHRGLEVLR